jgi:hypothetical protein
MLFTITTTHSPATDLGYLPHKHPGRVQSFERTFGRAYVSTPKPLRSAAPRRCCWTWTPLDWSVTAGGRRAKRGYSIST